MKTIWKFPIPVQDDIIEISMPKQAEIVHVAWKAGQLCLWAIVETESIKGYESTEIRKFRVRGTGHEIKPNVNTGYNTYDTYVGTALVDGLPLVWHVFEVK